ncbi:MAG: MATE family efflux transporter [Erysipelotrichaceae bacterium]|nr:MATE family efflux transporter [Erysipelotrichaceae bacterium]
MRLFDNKVFNDKLIRLAFPLALQSLMLAAVAAADAIMLGRLNQNSMSAVSLAQQVQFVMNMFLSAAVTGGSILAAQYWGRHDLKSMQDIFHIMLRLAVITDAVFGVLCICFPERLMLIFTNDAELLKTGSGYLHIAGWSYLLVGISQCYQTMMKVTEHASTSALISSSAVIINIILNTILIFGLAGFPLLGANGAAIATLLSRVIELVWSVGISFKKDYMQADIKHILKRNALLDKDFLHIASPILGASLLWGIGFTAYSAIMGHLGQDAAAANSVAAVVRDLLCCMCNGIAGAGAVMLGNELGRRRLDIAEEYGTKLMKISFLIGLMTMGLVLMFIPVVLRFYKLTPEAERLLTGMFVITSVYMIGRCVNTIMINGIFDGGGDTKFDIYSLIVAMWCIAIPTALSGAFIFHWPVLLVYSCTCLDEVGKIPWTLYHFTRRKWLNNLTRNEKDSVQAES